jgi:hypothetical protein
MLFSPSARRTWQKLWDTMQHLQTGLRGRRSCCSFSLPSGATNSMAATTSQFIARSVHSR